MISELEKREELQRQVNIRALELMKKNHNLLEISAARMSFYAWYTLTTQNKKVFKTKIDVLAEHPDNLWETTRQSVINTLEELVRLDEITLETKRGRHGSGTTITRTQIHSEEGPQ